MNLPREDADPTLVSALLRAAVEPEAQVRGQAILALGSIRAPDGADIFLRALSEDDWANQMFAATAIGWMPDPRAVEGLGRLLQHEEPLVRGAAAFALGAIGTDESAAVLRASREEERDPDVREAIDEALGKLDDQGGVP
jgi:HEAT repeat-containing taxis protein